MMHEVAVNRQPTRRSSSTAEPVAVQAKALSEACLAARAACEGRDDLLGAAALGAVIARYADWHGGALSDDAFARRLRAQDQPPPAEALTPRRRLDSFRQQQAKAGMQQTPSTPDAVKPDIGPVAEEDCDPPRR